MKVQAGTTWQRRGLSLLWDAAALSCVVTAEDVVSLRTFFRLSESWPSRLPGSDGNSLVVVGVEGCLDVLSREDGEEWLQEDLRSRVLGFQDEYEGQAALILWLPSGRSRIRLSVAREEYFWRHGLGQNESDLPIGRCLCAGAESDVARIVRGGSTNSNVSAGSDIGLYHPRLS